MKKTTALPLGYSARFSFDQVEIHRGDTLLFSADDFSMRRPLMWKFDEATDEDIAVVTGFICAINGTKIVW